MITHPVASNYCHSGDPEIKRTKMMRMKKIMIFDMMMVSPTEVACLGRRPAIVIHDDDDDDDNGGGGDDNEDDGDGC